MISSFSKLCKVYRLDDNPIHDIVANENSIFLLYFYKLLLVDYDN